jgi:hypothetical protein
MYRAAVLLFALTLSAYAQDMPKQDCYEPGSIFTMNFSGKDSILVISNVNRKDAPRLRELVRELMKKYDRDLQKVEAAIN